MKRSRFSDEQILAIVKEGEAGPESSRHLPNAAKTAQPRLAVGRNHPPHQVHA